MSAHNKKKKRIGSRRRVVNQNETSEADEFHLTDSSSIPQHIPEENKEPLNVLANRHDSLSETPNPPSPELLMNRRKLGSSRRSKDSATKSSNKPREEVEEKIMGKETPKTTQMSLAVQPLELQEELGQGSEHGIMSATHSSSLFSAVAPDDSIEVQCSPCKNCPVADLDGLIPKSEHLQADRDENDTYNIAMSEAIVLGRNDKSDTLQSEDPKAHPVGLSELSTLNVLSFPAVDQHQIDQLNSREMLEEELPNVYSVTKNESKESDTEAELLHQDGNLQGNYLVSESQEKSVVIPFPTTSEKTRDKSSPRENTELENSIEQEIISSPNKKLPKDEEQNRPYNLNEVQGSHHLEDAINNVHKQNVKEKENTKNTTKNSDITATLEGMHKPDTLHNQEEGTPRSEDAVNRVPEQEFETTQEINHEKKDEVTDIISGNEALETMQMLVTIERTNQKDLNQSSGDEHVGLVTQDSSLFPAIMSDYSSEVQSSTTPDNPKTDPESLFPKSENRQEDDNERETDSKVEVSDKSVGAALEEMYKTDTFQSQEVRDTYYSGDAVNTVHEQQAKTTPEINHTSETVSHDITKNSEMISGNLIDQAEVGVSYLSELIVKSADDFTTKQKDSNPDGKCNEQFTKDNSFKALGPSNEDFDLYDTKQLEISDIERVDTASSLVYEIEEDDLKPNAEQTGLFSEMEGTNSSKILRDGNLQDNYFVSESHLKSEDTESSITPEISIEKSSPEEHTEPECSVEQAIVSSPNEKLPLKEEQDEILNSSEIPCAHHLEDYVNSVHEQQVKPRQMHEISHSFKIVTHDSTENSEIISGDLTDQFEVGVTFQSELTVKTSDDSTTQREGSNPDDKHDMHHIEENGFRALEQTNEDHHVYDNRKPEVNDAETAETGHIYDMEVQADNDLKPSTEQTGYQEEEGTFSNSALQNLQSDIQAHLVHQPQPEDTNFKPIGDRKKLGSSRRHKGRQHAKDSFAESYHRPTEEVFGNIRDNTPETAVQVQEKSVETLQEGIDTIDIIHTEEINDQVKENKHIGIHADTPVGNSELSAPSIHSSSTVDQELIGQLHFTEMSEVELLNLNSATEKESKNEEKDTELLRQDGNLQDNYLVSDSHLKSENTESSITPEISIEKSSPEEHTEPECSVEQAIVSSPNEKLPLNEEQDEILNSSEIPCAHHLEDYVNSVHEQQVKPRQMHEISHSFKIVTHDSTENSEIISGDLTDQFEVGVTFQSELTVKTSDDSTTQREGSNPDDKHDMRHIEENDFRALEQTNEDHHVYDNRKPEVNDTETAETGHVCDMEVQADNDLKPSTEQTGYQEEEGVFSEMEESQSSLKTLNSEENALLDSQPLNHSVKTEDQTHTGFNLIENRRKLGSTRRKKGGQLVKESVDESYHEKKDKVTDIISGNEALETMQMLVTIERTNQKDLNQSSGDEHVGLVTQDSSLFPAIMSDYSSEVQSPTTPDYPKTDLESLFPKSENRQEDDNERETDSKVEVSDKSVGAALEEMYKTDTFQSQEVRDTHYSGDAVNTVNEQQAKTTPEINHTSETVSHDTTENSEMISGNLIDQAEVGVSYLSELIVKSADDFTTKQKDSNPDGKCNEQFTKDNSFKALGPSNEDFDLYDTKHLEISDIERVDTASSLADKFKGQVENMKPSIEQTRPFSEMEDSSLKTLQSDIQAHLVHQPQPEDTNFKPIGDRRKLGSSRRHKGRQHAKDSFAESYHRPTEEVFGNTRDNTPETAVQVQEKSVETLQEGIDTINFTHTEEINDQVKENKHVGIHADTPVGNSELSAPSIHSSSTVDQELIGQLHFTEMSEVELLNLNSATEKESKNEEKDTELLRQDGNLQDNYLVSDSHLKSENIESSLTQEISIEKSSPGKHTDIYHSIEQAALSSSTKEELCSNETSVKNLQECEEQTHTGFNPVGNRRKLGSSRRSKGRQLVKDCVTDPFQKTTEEFVENTKGSDVLEQKDACSIQKTEASSCEKDLLVQEINMQQTNDATETVGEVTVETVGDVMVKDFNTEVKSSVGVQVFGQDEVGEKCEVPIKKDREAQESNASQEVIHSKLFSPTYSTADALAQFDLRENLKVQLAADVPEESGIATAVGACDSQQGIQGKTLAGNSENLEKSKQRRRKMGSTRRTQLNRESEEGRNNDDENEIDFHKIEVAEAVADIKESEQNVDVNVEPLQLDGIHRDATKTDITGGNFLSSFKTTQRTQNDEERPENVNATQGQALKSAEAPVVAVADLEIVKPTVDGGAGEEHSDTQVSIQDPNNLNEGAHTENLEMKNASPKLYSARRRKMGSTRKSLSSRSKREDFHQKQEEDNEATEAITNDGDVKTESFPGIKEKEELQLHIETKETDSEQRQEKIIETVEYSNIGESNFKPPSHQTFEENPVSPGHLVETEQQQNPNYFPAVPSTSPKHDVMSETAGGRRRKLGSSRKSRGQQSNETQTVREDRITDTQNGRDDGSVMDESAIKTTKEESLSLDKISEVDENDQKPSSNISIEHPRPASEKTPAQVTPVQQSRAETRLSQESQKTFSLGSSAGAAVRSNAYNVMMVGDSSVGKTSFMNRAQSGKFSLDLPASVGLDSCMWTVVVDGKPVVLQLWDTAGQERFHSITRQIFHKAQAFLLMYDITSSQSFTAVRYWLNCIQEGAAENVTIVLLGNKSDHAGRQVQTQDGENLAKDYGFEFMECSAATGENVITSLETVARMLSQKLDTREETSVLHKESQQKKSSGCC